MRSSSTSVAAAQVLTPPASQSPSQSPSRSRSRSRSTSRRRRQQLVRGEGETWGSRTEEEGSLIIACCDETVKFFEIWAGDTKGRKGRGGRGLGNVGGVLGGSRILEMEAGFDGEPQGKFEIR